MNDLKFGMTAAEARSLGIDVPGNVPDTAVAAPSPYQKPEMFSRPLDGDAIEIGMRWPVVWELEKGG